MSEHPTEWLEALYDGELAHHQATAVRAHLDACLACRAAYDRLERLGQLLRRQPPCPELATPERFAAEVGLRLPHSERRAVDHRAEPPVGLAMPVAFLGLWAFAQAVLLVTQLALMALSLGLGQELLAPLLPAGSSAAGALGGLDAGDVSGTLLRLAGQGLSLQWLVLPHLLLSVPAALLYWASLAKWRATRA